MQIQAPKTKSTYCIFTESAKRHLKIKLETHPKNPYNTPIQRLEEW